MRSPSASDSLHRAREAQKNWAATPLSERVRFLARLRKQVAADRELLVEAIMADTGKPALDALGGDVLVTLEHMRFYERRAPRLLASRRVGRSSIFFNGCKFTEHLEPHGVVLVFGPANYPLQLSLVPTITALYAGNAVILKASEKAPSVAREIEEVLRRADLPPGLVQVVCAGPEESQAFIDAGPDFVFFTGSTKNGREIATRAAARGIPTLLELGGNDAALVFADCDMKRTTEGVVYGAFSNAGQVCVGIKRLFVEEPIYETFVRAVVQRSSQLRVGSGDGVDLGKLAPAAKDLFQAQVQEALDQGATLETAGPYGDGMPIILSNVPRQSRLLQEGAFGPVLCVQPFTLEEEAIAAANESPFALAASVWTRDMQRAHRITRALHVGNCSINDVIRNIANPEAAFGGNGASGYGRYHGKEGLRAFSRIKTAMENRSSRTHQVNWFPFTRKGYENLDLLIEFVHRPRGVFAALRRVLRLAFIAGILANASMLGAQVAHLQLKVRLPANAHGRIAYLLFSSPSGFPKDKSKALQHGFSTPVGTEAVEAIDIGPVPPGKYALSIYLDENGNGKLDSGMFGIPKEPVGASNNPRSRMGPPHFDDCVFTMTPATKTLDINLVRP
jgi:acyl-CoA reductase-like NAD-dependent aldehyde dehydrogenase/uncharacterized protein (DUF2141 family)